MFPITSSCGCAAMSIAPACLIESISAETSLTVAVETRRRMISRVLRATSCDATCCRRRSSAMNREHSPATFGLIGGVAVALIGVILLTQFNSFYQSFLILSAVMFSTVGVLLGLLIAGQPFGVVMSGIGVIALAGIVVNNNIVLIDTYNVNRSAGLNAWDAVIQTGAERLRPVVLTTVTTILGLLPMVLQMNIDIVGRSITFGAPSTQWWTQLATAIVGGLMFSTLLTLVLTPCMLVLGARVGARFSKRRGEAA